MISRNYRRSSNHGFSLIEIVTVIIVISILATITIVYYSSTRAQADDTRRLNDMKMIAKALEMYRIKNGSYPPNQSSSWARSNVLGDNFIAELKPYLDNKNTPVDPINDTSSYYRYFRYSAGNSGCDPSKGAFYVLEVASLKISRQSKLAKESNPLQCPNRTWGPPTENYIVYSTSGFEQN